MMTVGDWKATGERIEALRNAEAQIAQKFTADERAALGFEPAYNCTMLAKMNAKPRRYAKHLLIIAMVLAGLSLAAIAFSDAYARGLDAVNNPHIEGF